MAGKKTKPAKTHRNIISDAEWEKIKKFGQNVREERNRRGWTLEHLEERGYKSWKHWQDIESGNRNVNFTTIIRIAKLLKVGAEDLVKDI